MKGNVLVWASSGLCGFKGASISFLSLTKTFKYHFWLTQINKRKLGLTFKEWLN